MAIFYTVLNHEVSHYRYKKDRIAARKNASFHIVSEWHREGIVVYLKTTKKLHEEYKHLIEENRSKEFSELLDKNEDARSAIISLFNYFECISLGISQQIHDEEFMRSFFRGIFIAYLNDYEFYIQYRRKKLNNSRIWKEFTDLAARWRSSI